MKLFNLDFWFDFPEMKILKFHLLPFLSFLRHTTISGPNWTLQWAHVVCSKLTVWFENWNIKNDDGTVRPTSMLVTNDGDEMCWRKLWDLGDGFGRFCHQHPLSYNISFGHQQSKDVNNIEILSLSFKNCHPDKVTNIHLSPTYM